MERSSGSRYSKRGGRQRLDTGLDIFEPGAPLTLFGGMIALVPLLDGSEQTHGFFLAALEGATIAMVRRSLIVGGLAQIFLAYEHSGRLRPSQALAAGVADERRACCDVNVWGYGLFGGCIDKDRDAFFFGDRAYVRDAQRTLFCCGTGENVDHGGALRDLGPQLLF